MRLARILFFLTGLLSLSLAAHAQASTTSSVQKDPQAITILNQAIQALGGSAAISAIKDYTGTGSLVFHQNQSQQVTGTVTISGLGRGDFRMDSNLSSSGSRSLSILQGVSYRKREDGRLSRIPPSGRIPTSDAFPYTSPLFPSGIGFPNSELLVALNSSQLTVSYKGLVQVNGNSVQDVQIQLILPAPEPQADTTAQYRQIDLFIDPVSFQIVMTQDNVPNHVVHQIRYSNYTPISGVVVPFSISEQFAGQRTWDIQLSQISFNKGLQDSNFQLTSN